MREAQRLAAVLLLPWLSTAALAQSGGGLDLSWFSIAGGGGVSGGGVYEVSGTIGQAEVGLLSGGPYTVAGGFWSILQSEGAPLLRISLSGNNVNLSWSDSSGSYRLQQASMIGGQPGSWASLGANAPNGSAEKQVTLTVGAGSQFFRLQKQ